MSAGGSVSVVVSNYNGAAFLVEAVESALGQDARPLEVLVADDGSTDDSRSRLEPFRDRVEWVGLPHRGQAAALDDAIGRCRGEWIAFLESDDVWLAGKLRAALEAARGNPGAVAIQHSMRQVDATLHPLPTSLPASSRSQRLPDFLAGDALLTGMSALMVRRETLRALRPLPGDLTTCVDEYLQPRLLAAGPMFHIAAPLGLRRIHGENFYAEVRRDPVRLERYLELRDRLDAHLASFLREKGLALAAEHERRRRAQRLELELFAHRLRRSWRLSLRAWRDLIGLYGVRPYAAFKAAVLGLALVRPSLYFALGRVYERQTWLPRLRARLLP